MGTTDDRELRTWNFELAVEERADRAPRIVGHAALFDVYADMGWYDERIKPNTFVDAIMQDDVRALFNHDVNYVLGRNKAGTLFLQEDQKGLYVEVVPPETSFAKDLMSLIARRDISQMSFAFQVKNEAWDYGDGINDRPKRDITAVKLFDVSVVTFPAYEGTDVSVRSFERWKRDNPVKTDGVPVDIYRRRMKLMEVAK